jgi:predicted nucleic acid-binding protein
MSGDRAFVDTNVFLYLFSENEPLKRQRSLEAINTYDCQINTQILNEFCNVCIKKWHFPASEIFNALNKICTYSKLWLVESETIHKAVYLHNIYGYSYYDCLVLASAISYEKYHECAGNNTPTALRTGPSHCNEFC